MDWPLTAVAVLFLVAYAWPILDPGLAQPWPAVFLAITWAAWAAFALDYLARLILAERRGTFVRTHLFDLATIALPLLRPLRLLRLVTLLTVLNRYAGASLRGRVMVYVVGSTLLLLFVSALAVLDAERGQQGSNITTFDDAVWWSFTTVTTVGYGDRFPITSTGRFVACLLMIAGIALVGVVTAAFASWLIDRVRQMEEESQAATRRDVEALAAEVSALRAEIARSRTPLIREATGSAAGDDEHR